jgi:6-phospho-beta-glucosidase
LGRDSTSEVRVKIAVLGGGGFRVPLVYGALLERAERLGLDELALYDVDEERTERIRFVLEGIGQERGARLPLRTTSSLEDAV